MNHVEALKDYVRRLATHRWEEVAPVISEDAVFIFSEGTHIGKAAAKAAFEKTFAHIQDEDYQTSDVRWTVVTESVAICHYKFQWRGKVDGKSASGGGRGTSILVKSGDRWCIAHEHLGPNS